MIWARRREWPTPGADMLTGAWYPVEQDLGDQLVIAVNGSDVAVLRDLVEVSATPRPRAVWAVANRAGRQLIVPVCPRGHHGDGVGSGWARFSCVPCGQDYDIEAAAEGEAS